MREKHQAIIDALERQDINAAGKVIIYHNENAKKDLLSCMNGKQSE